MRVFKMRLFLWIVSLVFIAWIAGSAAAQTAPSVSGAGAHDHGTVPDPGAGGAPKPGGGMCPMMSGGGKVGMKGGAMHGMGGGMNASAPGTQKPSQMDGMRHEAFDLMRPFHAWIHRLATHRDDFDLTPDQVSRLDSMISGHYAFAIRVLGEIRALNVELKHLLRTNPDNIAAAEAALRRIGDQNLKLQMEGVRLYGGILQSLSEAQKKLLLERIGSPFQAPWNNGTRGMPPETPGDPSKSSPEGEKPKGHAGHG